MTFKPFLHEMENYETSAEGKTLELLTEALRETGYAVVGEGLDNGTMERTLSDGNLRVRISVEAEENE